MNLIEIQENLKDLPTQAIMAYANGQNPQVPPYIALGELNRRKLMEQRAAQPPTQSVKEQLEGEMSGLPSVMPPPVTPGAPPGMPPVMQRPPMPQAMPPQMAAPQAAPQMAAPRMAAGGLTNIPMNRDIFKYAPGGIVAFADESNEQLVPGGGGEMGEGTAGEAEARANMGAEGPPITARLPGGAPSALQGSLAPAVAMLQKIMAGGDQGPPIETKADIRTKLAEKAIADGKPELAKAITQMPGEALSALVTKLQAQNEASKAQFQEGEGKMGLAALSNALIAAGEATRGQKGSGFGEAFGGFGKSYNAATADEIKRKQAQSALERSQDIETAKLQAEIENLRAAYASGDVNEIQEAQKRVQEQKLKVQANQTAAAKDLIGAASSESQVQGTLAHYKALENQAKLNYDETVRHNASQAEIEKARLEFQRATKNADLALRQEQMDQLKDTKLTAEDKIANNVERNLLRPTSDYALALKAYSALPADKVDSQEGKFYKARLNKLRKEAYERVNLPVPPESILPKYEDFAPPPVKEEKSAFEKWFSGEGNSISSMGSETPAAPQLPASRANQFKVLR
jgi:hypothetical protein